MRSVVLRNIAKISAQLAAIADRISCRIVAIIDKKIDRVLRARRRGGMMPECMFRGKHVFGWSTLLCAALLTVAPVAVMAQSQPAPAAALVTDGSARILWQRVFASDHDDWINDI